MTPKSTPLVSIILPTYKPGFYLFECIESLIQQNYDSGDFEVIIILNGPNNPYFSRIKDYLNKLPISINIQLYYSSQIGVSNARNYGLKKATGDFIVFIDDDDIVSENYLSNLLRNAHSNIIVLSNVLAFDKSIAVVETDYLSRCFIRNHEGTPNLWNSRSYFSVVWGKIIPKELIGDKQFDARFSNGEDALFMASIASKVNAIQYESPDTVYYRRQRQGSSSRSKISNATILSKNMKLIIEYLKLLKFRHSKYYPFFILSRIIATLLQTKKRMF